MKFNQGRLETTQHTSLLSQSLRAQASQQQQRQSVVTLVRVTYAFLALVQAAKVRTFLQLHTFTFRLHIPSWI